MYSMVLIAGSRVCILTLSGCWLFTCVQVVQQKPIEAYRNTFANLALPLFAMAEPIPAKSCEYTSLKWSIWDRWILEGDLTVQVSDWIGRENILLLCLLGGCCLAPEALPVEEQ